MNMFLLVAVVLVKLLKANEEVGFSGQIANNDIVFQRQIGVDYSKKTISDWSINNDLSFYNYHVVFLIAQGAFRITHGGVFSLNFNALMQTQTNNSVTLKWLDASDNTVCQSRKDFSSMETMNGHCIVRLRRGMSVRLVVDNTAMVKLLVGSTLSLHKLAELYSVPSFALPLIPALDKGYVSRLSQIKAQTKDFKYFVHLKGMRNLKSIPITEAGVYIISVNIIAEINFGSSVVLYLNEKPVDIYSSLKKGIDTVVLTKTVIIRSSTTVLKLRVKNISIFKGSVFGMVKLLEKANRGLSMSINKGDISKQNDWNPGFYYMPFTNLAKRSDDVTEFFHNRSFAIGEIVEDPSLLTQSFGVFLVSLSLNISASKPGRYFLVVSSSSELDRLQITTKEGLSASYELPEDNLDIQMLVSGFLALKRNSMITVTVKFANAFRINSGSHFSMTSVKQTLLGVQASFTNKQAISCQNDWIPLGNIASQSESVMSELVNGKRKIVIPNSGVYLIQVSALVSQFSTVKKQHVTIKVQRSSFRNQQTEIFTASKNIRAYSKEISLSRVALLESSDELEFFVRCNGSIFLQNVTRVDVQFLKYKASPDYTLVGKSKASQKLWTIQTNMPSTVKRVFPPSDGVYFITFCFELEYDNFMDKAVEIETFVFRNDYSLRWKGITDRTVLNKTEASSRGALSVNVFGILKLSERDFVNYTIDMGDVSMDYAIKDLRLSMVKMSTPKSNYFSFQTQSDKIIKFSAKRSTTEVDYSDKPLFKSDITNFAGTMTMVTSRPMYMVYDTSVYLEDVVGTFALVFRIQPRRDLLFVSHFVECPAKRSVTLRASGVIYLLDEETVQLQVYGRNLGNQLQIISPQISLSMVELLSPIPQQPIVVDNRVSSSVSLPLVGNYLQLSSKVNTTRSRLVQVLNDSSVSIDPAFDLTTFVFANAQPSITITLIPGNKIPLSVDSDSTESIVSFLAITLSETQNAVELSIESDKNKIFSLEISKSQILVLNVQREYFVSIRKLTESNKDLKRKRREVKFTDQNVQFQLVPLSRLKQINGFSAFLPRDIDLPMGESSEWIIDQWSTSSALFFDQSAGFNYSGIFFVHQTGYYVIGISLVIEAEQRCEVGLVVDDSWTTVGKQYTNTLYWEEGAAVQVKVRCPTSQKKMVTVKNNSMFYVLLKSSEASFSELNNKAVSTLNGKLFKAVATMSYNLTCSHSRQLISNIRWYKGNEVLLEKRGLKDLVLNIDSVSTEDRGYYSCLVKRGDVELKTPKTFFKVIDPRPSIKIENSTVYVSENMDHQNIIVWLEITTFDFINNIHGAAKLSILKGNEDDIFYFDPEVTKSLTRLRVRRPFDYETTNTYNLSVLAQNTDYAGAAGATTVNITVYVVDTNDNGLIFENSETTVEIEENSRAESVVFELKAIDKDANAELIYDLMETPDVKKNFEIDRNTGVITTIRILDHEEKSQYNLFAMVSDGTFVAKELLTVKVKNLNDNSPYFTQTSYIRNLTVSTASGSNVLQLRAYDADEQGDLTYTIIAGNEKGVFRIVKDNILLEKKVDQELAFRLKIQVADTGGRKSKNTADAWISFADHAFRSITFFMQTQYAKRIFERCQGNTRMSKLVKLKVNPRLERYPITYKVIPLDSFPTKDFKVTEKGVVYTNATLDYEQTRQTGILVRACAQISTQRHMCEIAHVKISVVDSNDNAPVFDKNVTTVFVPRETKVGSLLTTVTAIDKDTFNNGEVSYNLVNKTTSFSIDTSSGELFLQEKFNETVQRVVLVVDAADNGAMMLKSRCLVVINIEKPRLPVVYIKTTSTVPTTTTPYVETFDRVMQKTANENWQLFIHSGLGMLLLLALLIGIALCCKYRRVRKKWKKYIKSLPTKSEVEFSGLLKYLNKPVESIEVSMDLSCETLPSAYHSRKDLTTLRYETAAVVNTDDPFSSFKRANKKLPPIDLPDSRWPKSFSETSSEYASSQKTENSDTPLLKQKEIIRSKTVPLEKGGTEFYC